MDHELEDGSCASLASRSYSFTQYHRQFLCYLDGDSWTPASKLPEMPRTARSLQREGLIETMVVSEGKMFYRITQKGAARLAAPRR